MNHFSTKKDQTQLVYLSDGRPIGSVSGVFLNKSANAKKHMLNKPKGWASDITVIEQAEQMGAKYFIITDFETNIRYIALLQDFWNYGKEFNRRYSDQIVLPIIYWKIILPGENITLPVPKKPMNKINVVQKKFDLPFFGE
jgi:hypothetical protein